jgi:hypothetical protein
MALLPRKFQQKIGPADVLVLPVALLRMNTQLLGALMPLAEYGDMENMFEERLLPKLHGSGPDGADAGLATL